MKKLVVLMIFLFFSLISLPACQSSQIGGNGRVAGKYVNVDDSTEYLELHDDGTYYLLEFATEFTGTWQVEGETLTLTFDDMPANITAKGTINGNTIVDQDGKTWVKE